MEIAGMECGEYFSGPHRSPHLRVELQLSPTSNFQLHLPAPTFISLRKLYEAEAEFEEWLEDLRN